MSVRGGRDAVAASAFHDLTGRSPAGVWVAPGRLNLIGDHTDYNDGLVLPVAIDRSAALAVGLRDDQMIRCVSLQVSGEHRTRLREVVPGGVAGWAAYLLGTLWALRAAGVTVPGLDLVVDSDIPIGGGLSSSAALEVATAVAVTELTRQPMDLVDLARCCQKGENAIVGAPTGIMDQVAVLAGRRGHAVFLDCRTLAHELVTLAPEQAARALLVIDTSVRHDNSTPGYRARRQESSRAAAALGVDSLREATRTAVDTRLEGDLQRRARHVVSENERVAQTVELLRGGRLADIGRLLDQSHTSLRDDYDVSCAELDLAVQAARDAGAVGARMTGAGFGGCAIALTPIDRTEAVAAAVGAAFAAAGHPAPTVFSAAPADGARRLS